MRPGNPHALALAAGLLLLAAAPAASQDPNLGFREAQIVDRVAAVVGDSAIFLTEVQERILQMGASGMELPQDPAGQQALQAEVLESLINEQLLVQAASRDTLIVVNEEQLEALVQQEWEDRTSQFPGGEQAMLRALAQDGFTPSSYRDFLRGQIRKQQLQGQLVQQRMASSRNITVSEDEIQAFFDQQAGQLPERPATISFEQAVLQALPSQEAKDSALAQAQRILEMFRSGDEEFEDLARRFSDDPGSQRNGGDLGWFRRGGFVREFEDAAFALYPGQVSEPVGTMYGYHIILVERVRGPERKARHILVSFDLEQGDLDASRERAAELRELMESGASREAIADSLGEALMLQDSLTIPTDRLGQLPPEVGNALRVATEGAIIGPVNLGGRPDAPNLGIIKVLDVREAGPATLDDLRDQIEARILQEKILDDILGELRERTYISIKI